MLTIHVHTWSQNFELLELQAPQQMPDLPVLGR